jgi:hypothetical protein
MLNRIHNGDPTSILGTLNANGKVFIVNPAGVLFGAGSQVNVNQLVASSLNITDGDFLDGINTGEFNFEGGIDGVNPTDMIGIINNGTITGNEGVALIGQKILNAGTISTGANGFVVMAAGDTITLGEPGSKIIVEMTSSTSDIEGAGTVVNDTDASITSPSGQIILAAGDIYATPLHPQLDTLAVRVELGEGTVIQSGDIDAAGGTVVLTAGDDVVLESGSNTDSDGGEVSTYAYDFADKDATTTFENGATITTGTGTASINGNHVMLAGDITASVGGKIKVGSTELTIADGAKPASDVTLDTIYETWVENYSLIGVDLDLAADESITVDYMNDGEITGGSGDIYLRNMFDTGKIEFLANAAGARTTVRTMAYYENSEVYRDGGNIYMDAGSGNIIAGDLYTGTEAPDKMSQPGEIVLRTSNGGDITVGNMKAEGASNTQVSAISSGYLTVNGNAESISQQTDNEDQSVYKAILCLIAEKDVDLNGTVYLVETKGKSRLTSAIRISAGENVYIGSTNSKATISATSRVAQGGTAIQSTADVTIDAGRNLFDDNDNPTPGIIEINGETYTSGSGYLNTGDIEAIQWSGGKLSVDTAGNPTSSVDTESTWVNKDSSNPETFFASIIINNNKVVADGQIPCPDCPTPPGLPPVPKIFIIADDLFDVSWRAGNRSDTDAAMLDVLENDDNYNRLSNGTIFGLADGDVIVTDKGVLTYEEIEINGEMCWGFTYTPDETETFVWDGASDYSFFTDTFEYQAVDAQGNVSVNTADVTITVKNIMPVLSGDSDTIHMSTATNPTDADFNLTTYVGDLASAPAGTLIIDEDGTPGSLSLTLTDPATGDSSLSGTTATYTPIDGFTGNESFSYTATDSSVDYQDAPAASANLSVEVTNAAPTAEGGEATEHMANSTTPTVIDPIGDAYDNADTQANNEVDPLT